VKETPYLWGEPEDVVVEGEDAFSVVEGDNFTLKCASSVYNNTQHPVWYTDRGTVHNSTGQASAKLLRILQFNFILFYLSFCCSIEIQCILMLLDQLLLIH
jgi:hypothetical protein